MFRAYLALGLMIVSLFSWAQYRGWSIYGVSEGKPQPGSVRSAYHK